MRLRWLVLVLVLIALGMVGACRSGGATSDTSISSEAAAVELAPAEGSVSLESAPDGPGDSDDRTCRLSVGLSEQQIVADGRVRDYRLFVPDAPGQLPVVFDFHGAGSSGAR